MHFSSHVQEFQYWLELHLIAFLHIVNELLFVKSIVLHFDSWSWFFYGISVAFCTFLCFGFAFICFIFTVFVQSDVCDLNIKDLSWFLHFNEIFEKGLEFSEKMCLGLRFCPEPCLSFHSSQNMERTTLSFSCFMLASAFVCGRLSVLGFLFWQKQHLPLFFTARYVCKTNLFLGILNI